MERIKSKVYGALRGSEKYAKTDMVYLAKNSFWPYLEFGISILVGLVSSIVFANFIPKDEFGVYKYLLSIVGILSAISLTGMGTSVAKSIAQGSIGIFKPVFQICKRWNNLIIIPSLIISTYYFINKNNILGFGVLSMAILLPLIKSYEIYSYFLIGGENFKLKALYSSIKNTSHTFIMVIISLITINPLTIILTFLLSQTITNKIAFNKTWKLFKVESENSDISPTIKYAKHLSIMNFLSLIMNHFDKILVFHFLGSASLAIYSFAILPIEYLTAFGKTLNTILLPKFAKQTLENLKKNAWLRFFILFLFSLILTILYILLAPIIFNTIFKQYTDSIFYSQVAAIIVLFIPNIIFFQALESHAQNKALYLINTTRPIIKLILIVALIPKYGILGAILALIITQIYHIVISAIFFFKSKTI